MKTAAYMEMTLHTEGKEPLILRIPTFWDAVKGQWIGFIQTPATKRMIYGQGKTSLDLQNDFNINLSEAMHDKAYSAEVFAMFKPESEWKEGS